MKKELLNNRFNKIAFALLCCSAIFIGKVNFASEENSSVKLEKIEHRLEEDNISFEDKNAILEKVKNNELLDSEKNFSVPVYEENSREDDLLVKKLVYADKSYKIIKMTDIDFIINNSVMARSGSYISDSGTIVSRDSYHTQVSGAIVTESTAMYSASFRFDYIRGRNEARIYSAYSPSGYNSDGTISFATPRVVVRTYALGRPARAELTYTIKYESLGRTKSKSSTFGVTVTPSGISPY